MGIVSHYLCDAVAQMPSDDTDRMQKLILMPVLSPTKVSFDRWLPQAHRSSQANISLPGVVSNQPVKLSAKLHVFQTSTAALESD
jgi:hypothetical protein